MDPTLDDRIDDALFHLYLEADENFINEVIEREIEDPKAYEKKIKQIIFLAKATANKKNDEYILTLVEKFQDALLKNLDKPISILKQLVQQDASLAFYKNLENLTNEDIVEIIKDKNLVELLEELERNENK